MHTMSTKTYIPIALLLAAISMLAHAQPSPEYPRVNPSPYYVVDADWPTMPPGMEWAAVPGVTFDKSGNVVLFTRGNPSVQFYSPEGTFLHGWEDRTGSHHIAVDDEGFVWTTDTIRHIVQKHEADGTVVMTLGTDGVSGEDATHFFKPTDVDFASNGDIFVSDGYGNARVVRYDRDGNFIKAWGSMGNGPDQFSICHAIAIDSKDRIYVADRNNARIQVFDMEGTLLDSWSNLMIPWGVCVDDEDTVWVCGSSVVTWESLPPESKVLGVPPNDQWVARIDTTGKMIELHAFPKGKDGEEKPGELNWVHCIAVDEVKNLYLGDINGERLQKFLRKAGE